jgi:hypothetical protein
LVSKEKVTLSVPANGIQLFDAFESSSGSVVTSFGPQAERNNREIDVANISVFFQCII